MMVWIAFIWLDDLGIRSLDCVLVLTWMCFFF